VATAIGEAGGDIEAIEIVQKVDGYAVDDVLLETAPGAMPDSIVSACSRLDGVTVLWINRYAAGGNLFLDLEVVEALTEDPNSASDRIVDMLPMAFRVDWAVRLRKKRDGVVEVVHATGSAPTAVPWPDVDVPTCLPGTDMYVECAAPYADDMVVMGRRGGPEFLDSELARLSHLLGLAASIGRA
jgi:hypothetical protein